MAPFVYALCALTSLVCCVLLFRQYRRVGSLLVFRSSLAFLFFGISNVLLFLDLIVFHNVDLKLWRNVTNLIGVVVLLLAVTHDEDRRAS